MPRRQTLLATLLLVLAATGACGPTDGPGASSGEDAAPALGPVDGHDLPATDLERVVAGDLAPDFTLASLAGPRVTLSDFRGSRDVVLVFYRGHW